MKGYDSTIMTLREQPLVNWVQHHANEDGERPAVAFAQKSISYSELDRQSRCFANGLKSLGVGSQDVVAVQLPNVPEFIIAYLAICRIGATMQTLHMPYRAAELKHLLTSSRARAVVCLRKFKDIDVAAEMLQLQNDTELKDVIVIGEPTSGTVSASALMSATPLDRDFPASLDGRFLLLYTSGTTSSPKGVPISYSNFMGNANWSASELTMGVEDRVLSLAPMTHLYGLFALHVSLISGATYSLLPAFSPDGFVEVLETDRPTAIFAGPAHLNLCLRENLLTPEVLRDARFICLSGSAVSPALAEKVDSLMPNGNVIQLWGMSELQAGSFGRPSDPSDKRLHTAGRASPHTELRVIDRNGTVLPADEEGEIQVRGPSVFSGYLNNDRETNKVITDDGWFCSGDLGLIDSQGYLRLTGRKKDVINRGGIKYNPQDVEELIDQMEEVQRSAIVAVHDPVLGEKACVFVMSTPAADLSLDDIKVHLSNRNIAKYKWPEMLEFVEEMPLTPTQKVIKGKLALR